MLQTDEDGRKLFFNFMSQKGELSFESWILLTGVVDILHDRENFLLHLGYDAIGPLLITGSISPSLTKESIRIS